MTYLVIRERGKYVFGADGVDTSGSGTGMVESFESVEDELAVEVGRSALLDSIPMGTLFGFVTRFDWSRTAR